jgi:hypothetical protein
MVILMCGGDWHSVDELELEKPRCSSGLKKVLFAAALGRILSLSRDRKKERPVWNIVVEQEDNGGCSRELCGTHRLG